MKRANLLLTDQSSSGSKMTTTGHSTPSGSTRTKATKGLLSHFMFLASLLLIALLTSGKALADDYTITIVGSNLTIEGGNTSLTQDVGIKTFKLVPGAGYKLPETLTSVVYDVANAGGTALTLDESLESTNQYSYNLEKGADYGTITISAATTIAATKVITITASSVPLGTVATLEALTYSNTYISSGSPQSVLNFAQSPIPDITLAYDKNLKGSTITMAGTPTTGSNATITTNEGAIISDGAATATVTVTSEDGNTTKDYVVTFKLANDQLNSITVPEITLARRVSTAAEALELLNNDPNNSFDVVTTGQQEGIKVSGTWSFTNSFDAEAGHSNTFTWTVDDSELTKNKLDQNGVALTGTASVTNAAASTDVKLSALTYSIKDGASNETVTNFKTSDNEPSQTYNVTLSADVSKDAEITVNPTANDEKAQIDESGLTKSLSANTVTITFTVTPESGGTPRTVNVIFTRTPSDDATLASLKYKIGANGAETDVPGFSAGGTTYSEIPVPYNTTETITILPVATDKEAQIEGNTEVTLSGGTGSTTLTVTAENGSATQVVTISFLAAKANMKSITKPVARVRTAAMAEDAVVGEVSKIETVTATLEGGTKVELPVTWALKDQTKFTAVAGAKNTYTWTATSDKYDLDGHTTGEMEVVNYAEAQTGDMHEQDLTISDADGLFTQIGSEEAGVETTIKSVTVNSALDELNVSNATVNETMTVSAAVGALNFNKATVTGTLSIAAAVKEISFADATISSKLNVTDDATSLSVVVTGNTEIAQITNAGTLTLNDAAGVTPLSLAVDTKAAALNNTGAVKAVENSGTFIDNTASIVTVTGTVDLSITSLPRSQSTYGEEVTLAVVAETATGKVITYQWQKSNNGEWKNATGTGNNAATLTVSKSGDGAGSFRCQVVSTKNGAATTLYTPAAAVAFLTESDPSEPSNPSTPTYTVSLDKVAGATFSKGETTTVDEGGSFSFTITLDKDYDQSKPVVTVNGKALEADTDGNYTIKNIREDMEIVVTGIVKNTATGTEDITADSTRAWSEGSTLHIHAQNAATAYIFTATGALQQQLQVAGDQTVQLHAGFYIVRIGNYTAKVIIR